MKEIKNYLNESSFDNYTNIIDSIKKEFRTLASHADDKEYKYETYNFIYETLKCFDVSETYLLKNLDKNIIEEIKKLRHKIRDQYL